MGLKAMADVCLHPSKTEGFGLNALECQAVGIPIITTNFSAMQVGSEGRDRDEGEGVVG